MSRVNPRDRQFAEWLEKLRDDPHRGRAAMAALKRALGKAPGLVPDADRYILPWLSSKPTRPEEDDEAAYYLVASLFGSHQKSWAVDQDHRGPTNFGASMRLLADAVASKESVERRFVATLNSDFEYLGEHLRHDVSFLKANSIGIDWPQLLTDIRGWQSANRHVQREWARAFWGESVRQPDEPGDAQELTGEPEPQS